MNYYEILDIARSATANEIKGAFKRQVLIWHRDKNPDHFAQATQRFTEIREAYEVLSDPEKKSEYDVSHPADEAIRLAKAAAVVPAVEKFVSSRMETLGNSQAEDYALIIGWQVPPYLAQLARVNSYRHFEINEWSTVWFYLQCLVLDIMIKQSEFSQYEVFENVYSSLELLTSTENPLNHVLGRLFQRYDSTTKVENGLQSTDPMATLIAALNKFIFDFQQYRSVEGVDELFSLIESSNCLLHHEKMALNQVLSDLKSTLEKVKQHRREDDPDYYIFYESTIEYPCSYDHYKTLHSMKLELQKDIEEIRFKRYSKYICAPSVSNVKCSECPVMESDTASIIAMLERKIERLDACLKFMPQHFSADDNWKLERAQFNVERITPYQPSLLIMLSNGQKFLAYDPSYKIFPTVKPRAVAVEPDVILSPRWNRAKQHGQQYYLFASSKWADVLKEYSNIDYEFHFPQVLQQFGLPDFGKFKKVNLVQVTIDAFKQYFEQNAGHSFNKDLVDRRLHTLLSLRLLKRLSDYWNIESKGFDSMTPQQAHHVLTTFKQHVEEGITQFDSSVKTTHYANALRAIKSELDKLMPTPPELKNTSQPKVY